MGGLSKAVKERHLLLLLLLVLLLLLLLVLLQCLPLKHVERWA